MMSMGQKLFGSIYKKKRMAHANHDVHLLARTRNEWLPQGIQSINNGTYTPRFLKRYYTDLKVQHMLENIIKNPIETPKGYKNPDNGIALRGPLSQFFSALYLKPLDDAFDTMDVVYLRYQDDVIILCKTKRQLERCKRRMMTVLQERQLQLSRKKTRIGAINKGFHFLGIQYLETQSPNNTCVPQDLSRSAANDTFANDCLLFNQTGGG